MEALSFDDVLLIPGYSEIESRKDVDVEVNLFGYLQCPILSANMPSVTNPRMAIAMQENGCTGVLHRFNTIEEAVSDYLKTVVEPKYSIFYETAVSLGVKDYVPRSNALYEAGARIFFVDVAHGHHKQVYEAITYLKSEYCDSVVVAGNIVTTEAASCLAEVGADGLKVGVGPGAACITREVTGFGVPQVTAIENVSHIKNFYPDIKIIADGGIKNSGDIVKALYFGADAVMIGSLFAGADEAPIPGEYYGNASHRVNGHNAPEGIHGTVERKGPIEGIIKNLLWGVRSGFSYAGANNVEELRRNVRYTTVSSNTLAESRARVG